MTHLKIPIHVFLGEAGVMIGNGSSDPVLKTALSRFGYHEEKWLEGKTLHHEAEALHLAWRRAAGEQEGATAEFKKAWALARKQYMKALKIARAIFKDDIKARVSLMLQGERKQDFAGWYKQAHTFYMNILDENEWINLFSEYGYRLEVLRHDCALVEQALDRNSEQLRAMDKARGAVENRDRKLAELARWLGKLKVVARVALEDDPQQMEKMGVVIKS